MKKQILNIVRITMPKHLLSALRCPLHALKALKYHYQKVSKKLLGPLLHNAGQTDCFIHDSLHTYEHMIWEFRTVWPYLKLGGLFLSHDVGANDAFLDFMKENDIPWSAYRVFHVLGGFRKV